MPMKDQARANQRRAKQTNSHSSQARTLIQNFVRGQAMILMLKVHVQWYSMVSNIATTLVTGVWLTSD
jgi:uncharacterized membrane protein